MISAIEDELWHDGAKYRCAMQPWYSAFVCDSFDVSRTAGRLDRADLDLLSGKGLVTAEYFLQSAPNGLTTRRCMVSQRERSRSDAIVDSGGYQVSTGKLVLTEDTRRRMLRYAEEFEAGCILDVPTSAIGRPGTGFYEFRDCLAATMEGARYAIRNRVPGKTHLLNVTQGRSPPELREWVDAVKPFNDPRIYGERALDGWAPAGAMRLRFSHQLPLLIELRDEGLIRPGARIHTLGTGHPEVACALTAVQDGLRETVDEGIVVSFDNASPFIIAGKYKKAFATYSLTRKKLFVPIADMPCDDSYVGSEQPWPCGSPFADRLTLGDLNVRSRHPKSPWDIYSYVLLAAHNVWMLSKAIAEAVRRLRLSEGDALNWLPRDLVEMTQVIREVFRSERPMSLVRQHATLLDQLGNKSQNTTMINDPVLSDR